LRLESSVIGWGIQVEEAGITNVNPGHGYNKKIQDRNKTSTEKDATTRRAEGEKQKRTLEGQGTARAEKALLEARAEGYAKIAKTAKTEHGQIAISADVAGKIAGSDTNTVVVGADGLKDLLGIISAAKKVK